MLGVDAFFGRLDWRLGGCLLDGGGNLIHRANKQNSGERIVHPIAAAITALVYFAGSGKASQITVTVASPE